MSRTKVDADLLSRIRWRARRLIAPEFAYLVDDIVGDVALSMVEKGKGQTVDQAIIDALRGYVGRGPITAQRKKFLYAKQFAEEHHTIFISNIESLQILQSIASRLSERDRVMFLLKFEHDWSLEEIAPLLGVTASRVSQVFSQMLDVVRGILNAKTRFNLSKGGRRIPKTFDYESFVREYWQHFSDGKSFADTTRIFGSPNKASRNSQ